VTVFVVCFGRTESYLCASSFRAVIDFVFFQPFWDVYVNPVPTWYQQNYKCVSIYETNEWFTQNPRGSWPQTQLCWPMGLPYDLTFSRTGLISGQYCTQMLNDRDPYWLSGQHYLCDALHVPYYDDVILRYHYAPPYISQVIKGNGTQAGILTIIGTSFGFNVSNSVTLDGAPCAPIYSWSHTQVVCVAPAGLGANKPLQIVVEGQYSNIVKYSYDAPVIISVVPPYGVTQGGQTIVINGNSLVLALLCVVPVC
jgi:hypothetical protein